MHWALFVYFNYPKGRDEIIEMFLNQQPYLNTIQVEFIIYRIISIVGNVPSSLKISGCCCRD